MLCLTHGALQMQTASEKLKEDHEDITRLTTLTGLYLE